jgi:hypothetical protein
MGKNDADIKSGRACFSWADLAWLINEAELNKYGLSMSDFGFIPMPVKDESIKNPVLSGGECVTFNPKASKEEIEAAFKFFDFYYFDEEYLAEVWKILDENDRSSLQTCANPALYEKMLKTFSNIPESIRNDMINGIKNAKPEPACLNWNDMKNALVIPLQKILLSENITREECKKLLDACAEELYNKYPDAFRK